MTKTFCDICGKEYANIFSDPPKKGFDLCAECKPHVRRLFGAGSRVGKLAALANIAATITNRVDVTIAYGKAIITLHSDDFFSLCRGFEYQTDEEDGFELVICEEDNITFRAYVSAGEVARQRGEDK